MPALLFIQIGMVAGTYGFTKAVTAGMAQRKARKINRRANRLLESMPEWDGMTGAALEIEPMAPAMKKGALLGAKAGILAMAGTYGFAAMLETVGREFLSGYFGGTAEKFAVLTVLGDGSPIVETAVLAGIAAGVLMAGLGEHTDKKAMANVDVAYSNLSHAERVRRESNIASPDSAGRSPQFPSEDTVRDR